MSDLDRRKKVLQGYGADSQTMEELLAYNENIFQLPDTISSLRFPLADEPFVSIWADYTQCTKPAGILDFLKSRLVQLNFPVRRGISHSDGYVAVTRRGVNPESVQEATGLQLRSDTLRLMIHQTHAGRIPILIAPDRDDFVSLVRALTSRNEPEPVPDSMGACIVSGYNNWDRIRVYRSAWAQKLGIEATEQAWTNEFQSLIPRKELYQDRFILLSHGFYSSVAPEAMNLTSLDWRQKSFVVRLEHECAHYFTRRVFHSMRNLVLDELIADYAGLVAAIGRFRADWFLKFMGLEHYPALRLTGRLSNYRGKPALSDKSFHILQRILMAAAESLEQFSNRLKPCSRADPLILAVISTQTLEELAAPHASLALLKLMQNSSSLEKELSPCEN